MSPRGTSDSEPMYLGPNGAVIDFDEWVELWRARMEDMSSDSWWCRKTTIGDVRVSTIWLGINHSWLGPPPVYWETMIFGGDWDGLQWRYSSRESALDDHERIVRALRAGESPAPDDDG
jgi:hypothetical protein